MRKMWGKKMWCSNWVSHQSGSSEENGDGEKKYEGELENDVMEGNVRVGAKITWCGIHAEDDTWVIHHS